ncbi:hypothetical protein B0J12DRAFT_703626 [Macrophomina phaseolina]|uniref:Secreted protein n=1 Tax=Macrophomina phaseolina TaxID=35725 RepID=A0ABQ8G0I7_9PEZI|nr:hypothetical protein B0J12DRAFT_703626 [Macrophomina phaseolina]
MLMCRCLCLCLCLCPSRLTCCSRCPVQPDVADERCTRPPSARNSPTRPAAAGTSPPGVRAAAGGTWARHELARVVGQLPRLNPARLPTQLHHRREAHAKLYLCSFPAASHVRSRTSQPLRTQSAAFAARAASSTPVLVQSSTVRRSPRDLLRPSARPRFDDNLPEYRSVAPVAGAGRREA